MPEKRSGDISAPFPGIAFDNIIVRINLKAVGYDDIVDKRHAAITASRVSNIPDICSKAKADQRHIRAVGDVYLVYPALVIPRQKDLMEREHYDDNEGRFISEVKYKSKLKELNGVRHQHPCDEQP